MNPKRWLCTKTIKFDFIKVGIMQNWKTASLMEIIIEKFISTYEILFEMWEQKISLFFCMSLPFDLTCQLFYLSWLKHIVKICIVYFKVLIYYSVLMSPFPGTEFCCGKEDMSLTDFWFFQLLKFFLNSVDPSDSPRIIDKRGKEGKYRTHFS